MKVIRDNYGNMKVLSRGGHALVGLEHIGDELRINSSPQSDMTPRQAAELAQALLTAVEIVNALNDGATASEIVPDEPPSEG